MTPRIAASILTADFAHLEQEIHKVQSADLLHIDVMDYHFVPNLTFGEAVAKRIIEVAPQACDVHLMIDNPDRWAVNYAKMGADSVTFHWGTSADPLALAGRINQAGAQACLAIKPAEPVDPILEIIQHFDMVLVMTVEPGFGSQALIPETLNKVQQLRAFVDENSLPLHIQVDGGINSKTIVEAVQAGADTFVVGSDIFNAINPATHIQKLRGLLSQNL
ncbi:MAG: ribulose-phosphate 3-epimerase [Bifidobacteriaceae bacterium]|jgi:ribulose-phosphate 3-epimerase|nr:ribulose-phosphate 3-epimerase [Bifidobacteriaceae bacterium]